MAYESRANPVIVLNKSDLCDDVAQKAAEVETIAAGVPVLALSAKTSQGLAPLLDFIKPGQTVAFIGSSGVGKSTLINTLLGSEVQKTGEVRLDDARGRHTTTHRELILMPQGGLLIDTPGMREMQLWGAGDGMADTFADIDRLAARCHFRDCTHTREARCAVLAALDSGELDASRYQSYLKLQKELAHLAERTQDKGSYFARKQRQKEIYRYRRQITKHKLSR
jgi:ribosome biogenesis GTPase